MKDIYKTDGIKVVSKKIICKATKEIRDTFDYLTRYDESDIINGRGHVFNVSAEGRVIRDIERKAAAQGQELSSP